MSLFLSVYFFVFCTNAILETNNITEVILMNFTETVPLNNIWPSDGITLEYSLTDFRKNPFEDSSHFVLFTVIEYVDRFNDTAYSMIDNIMLNLSHCTCTYSVCIDCKQQLNLFNFLSEKDVVSNEFDFTLSPQYNINALIDIVPSVITAYLQRCNISIYAQNPMSYFVVPFTFNVPKYCYSRIGEVFAINISLWTTRMSYYYLQLLIEIKEDGSKHCKVCDIQYNNHCSHIQEDSFNISYDVDRTDLFGDSTTFFFSSNMMDIYITSPYLQSINVPLAHKAVKNEMSIVGVIIICLVLFCCICFICNQCHVRCCSVGIESKGFVVNKVLVLIIGVSQFKDKKLFLDGVRKNVRDLRNLWEKLYKYDVFVCNENELYSTKDDVIQFIDHHKVKLEDNRYESVILHIISHGANQGETFLSSDLKNIDLEEIKYDLIKSASNRYIDDEQQPLIKIIFNHVCRGQNNYRSDKRVSRVSNNEEDEIKHNENEYVESEFSNWAILWGNISGRTISDDGDFTDCICEVFRKNAKKARKANFRELITKIGVKLQSRTDAAEISELSETLRQKDIRFEPWIHKKQQNQHQREQSNISMVSHHANIMKISRETGIDKSSLLSDLSPNIVKIEPID